MTENPFVPGTIHLVDIEGTLRAKHASGGQNDVVLIPAPSDDPDDPLNWSAKRKLLSLASISMCVYHLLFFSIFDPFGLAIRSRSALPPRPYIQF